MASANSLIFLVKVRVWFLILNMTRLERYPIAGLALTKVLTKIGQELGVVRTRLPLLQSSPRRRRES